MLIRNIFSMLLAAFMAATAADFSSAGAPSGYANFETSLSKLGNRLGNWYVTADSLRFYTSNSDFDSATDFSWQGESYNGYIHGKGTLEYSQNGVRKSIDVTAYYGGLEYGDVLKIGSAYYVGDVVHFTLLGEATYVAHDCLYIGEFKNSSPVSATSCTLPSAYGLIYKWGTGEKLFTGLLKAGKKDLGFESMAGDSTYSVLSLWNDFEESKNAFEYKGFFSEIYGGGDNLFFEGSDEVRVLFVGDMADGQMLNGTAEIKDDVRHVTYTGKIVDGLMMDDNAELTRIRSSQSMELFLGRFNGYEFDSCVYANTGTSEWYIGKMSEGKFSDDNALYGGPLHKIYDGDFSTYAVESEFLNFSPIHFDRNDTVIYRGSMRNGRVDGPGSLKVVHEGDTLSYEGQFKNAQVHGIGSVKVADLYSYVGHFANGQIAGLGEITSDNFSSIFNQSEFLPDGKLSIKGMWAGIGGLSEYFRATGDNGESVKLKAVDGKIEELNCLQRFGNWVSNTWAAEKLEQYQDVIQKIITGVAIVDAGVCLSLLVFPEAAPATGPICGAGFFGVAGVESALLTVLTFRAIDQECYTNGCEENKWKDFGKRQLVNVTMVMLPSVIGTIGKVLQPSFKALASAGKEFGYAEAIALSRNAKVVKELENLPGIRLPRVKEIDMVNDRLAFKQAVLDYTGKSFRDGFVEFFVRLKKSGNEDLIRNLWKSHKDFIKASGIRAGGVHEWLKADKFVDYLLNPKWGKDGAFLAYTLTKMTQETTEVVFARGGAHTVISEAGRKIPGPNSGSFHQSLNKAIESCSSAGCVFNRLNEFASMELTTRSYSEYTVMERAVLQ